MKIVVDNLDLYPTEEESSLEEKASSIYGADLKLVKILRRSIDARRRGRVVVKFRVVFDVSDGVGKKLLKHGCTEHVEAATPALKKGRDPGRVIVIGSGPAGLFAALRLMERGVRCTVLERGKEVAERHKDVERLNSDGVLDPESNVVFGEGGAGTYSDGKLTTRINKEGIEWLFAKLVEHGAPESILYDAKPHVGTDVISRVVVSVRRRLQEFGSEFVFGANVVSLVVREGRVCGVRTSCGREYESDHVVAACGNSARDFFSMLHASGVLIEQKPFAVGVRIEHPAEFINMWQFGTCHKRLPAADYRLTFNNRDNGRGTYSFCMCPGGEVINSSSEPDRLCVNGMSNSRRNSIYSNSAIVVSVKTSDLPQGSLGGIAFQRELEGRAYAAGGGVFVAPAAAAHSFVTGNNSPLGNCSYRPDIRQADFSEILPDFIVSELKLALMEFDKKIRGFISEGLIVGVETRTSSPVRIIRGDDFQSASLKNFYPAGEGAGYAGGIVSSAVDGARIADKIVF